MNRLRIGALAALLAVLLALAGCASVPPSRAPDGGPPSPSAPSAPSTPSLGWFSKIKAPSGYEPSMKLVGKGVQVFRCEKRDTGYAWMPRLPEAELRDDRQTVVGRHGANFSFEHTDGSRLLGTVAAYEDAPDTRNLRWLLLSTKPFGKGAFGEVAYVQRVTPPAACPRRSARQASSTSCCASTFQRISSSTGRARVAACESASPRWLLPWCCAPGPRLSTRSRTTAAARSIASRLRLQMPPNCTVEPTWRSRLTSGDLELWVVECDKLARLWLLKRQVVEMVGANQARLRFQVLDDQPRPEETAGESLSVQCNGRSGQAAGFAVIGAKWRSTGNELKLTSAQSAVRADAPTQKLVSAGVSNVECVRYPEREAMMRRLQQGPR